MNDLFTKQSKPYYRKLFGAISQIYRDGKKINSLIFWVAFINAVFIPLIASKHESIGIILSISFSLISSLVWLIFKDIPKKKTETAAKIQEQFDTHLYGWNTSKDVEDVNELLVSEAAIKYGWENISNSWWWYEDYRKLEKTQAILSCQKENLYWDKRQRNSYANFVLFTTIVVLLYSFILFIYSDIDLIINRISIILVPQIALTAHMIAIVKHNYHSSTYLEPMMERAQNIYSQYSNKKKSIPKKELLEIQRIIFENRKKGVLIPEWYYNIIKKTYQRAVSDAAKDLED